MSSDTDSSPSDTESEIVVDFDRYSIASNGTGLTDGVLRRLPTDNVWFERVRSRNETASDLPGHGRLLGKFYKFLGKKLERAAGAYAARAGLGPRAVAVRLSRYKYLKGILVDYDYKQMLKDCKALIKYARCVSFLLHKKTQTDDHWL